MGKFLTEIKRRLQYCIDTVTSFVNSILLTIPFRFLPSSLFFRCFISFKGSRLMSPKYLLKIQLLAFPGTQLHLYAFFAIYDSCVIIAFGTNDSLTKNPILPLYLDFRISNKA